MPISINHTFSARVNGGPSLVESSTLDYDAYEVIQVTIPADGTDVDVNLSADSGALLLAIMSTAYDDIKYDVAGGGSDIVLDGPHILIGAGIISLLDAAPGQLTFSKGSGDDAFVTILVGRDATL
jgi:hypothetical protein